MEGAHLLSVDPFWATAPPGQYVDLANVGQADQDARYEAVRANLSRYGDRSSVWRMTSAEAADRVPPTASTSSASTLVMTTTPSGRTLALWHRRVCPHGVLAGHDYLDGELPQGIFGVKRAVDEFCQQHGLGLHVTSDGPWRSWVVEIPARPVPPKLPLRAVPAEDRAS